MAKAAIAANLDLEYLHILNKIKPYITCIINTHYIGLIKVWLERLGDENFIDKNLRNIYLQRLWKQIEEGVLEYPFTDPPPDGELTYFTEDDNDSNYAAKGSQSSKSAKHKASVKGEGDVIPIKVDRESRSPEVLGDESSWLDISEYSCAPVSEYKEDQINRQLKVIDQLRYENNELLRIINKHNNHLEVNQDLNDKIIELQKQLASAMLRNVELQKNIQTVHDQREQYQKDSEELHKKELEFIKTRYLQSLEEREQNLKKSVELKYTDFFKKYNSLQEWYQSKVIEHDRILQEKSSNYHQKITDMKTRYEEEQKIFKQKQKDDIAQLKSCELKLEELKIEHQMQMEALRSSQPAKLEELRVETKLKCETHVAHYKKRIEDERTKHQQQIADQRMLHQNELRALRDEHQKPFEEHKIYMEKLKLLQSQLDDSREECALLRKQIDQATIDNLALSTQTSEYQKLLDDLRAEYEVQKETNQKQEQQQREAHEFQLAQQLKAYEQKTEENRAEHLNGIEKSRESQKQLIQKLQDAFEKQLKSQKEAYLRRVEEHRAVQKKLVEKMKIHFGEQQKAMQIRNNNDLKVEMLLKDECLRLYSEVKSHRVHKEKAKEEILRLQKEIKRLREIITKMTKLQCRAEKEFYKKINKMQVFHRLREKKYRVLLATKCNSPHLMQEFNNIVLNLESKYKQIVMECHATARTDKEKTSKRIAELELRLGLNLLKKVIK